MPELTPDEKYVAELERAAEQIWEIARRFGLDPFPVNFELVPATIMYEFGSYGLPGRFSHWTRGKSYYRMKTEYDYGLSKIYELVVNTNPSYAFLMEQNSLLQNKLVIAHVLGHTDFFKNNAYFKHTAPNMIDKVSVNADRIRKYEYDHGQLEVERFLDAVLAIEEHIDPNFHVKRPTDEERAARLRGRRQSRPDTPYDDLWNLDGRSSSDEEDTEPSPSRRVPPEPEKDLLLYLAEHAPSLEDWQRDILLIVREEMQYFVPQMQTKVMNEGWACLVGSSLVLTDQGFMRYDALHDRLAAGAAIAVATGHAGDRDDITDRHVRRRAPTIRIHTRRGLVIEGAEAHKLSVGPDQWMALQDLAVGQRIPLAVGTHLWPDQLVTLDTSSAQWDAVAEPVAVAAARGASALDTAQRSRRAVAPQDVRSGAQAAGRLANHSGATSALAAVRASMPTHLTERFAELLGYLTASAVMSPTQAIDFCVRDRALADRFAACVTDVFGLVPAVFADELPSPAQTAVWHAAFRSASVLGVLGALGVELSPSLEQSDVPAPILGSPRAVVSAYLRAYADCTADATGGDVTMAMRSDRLASTVQLILLNYGILTQRHGQELRITGQSAVRFEREIGCGPASRRTAPRQYLPSITSAPSHPFGAEDDPTDEIVRIEHGVADVYDITVDHSHRYIANGMLHHNSYWHARTLRELELNDAEYTEFAQLHSSVLAPQRMRINPYHLGYKMLEDIERRWDHPTEDQLKAGMRPGQGRKKIFEVREEENDVSFLRNYLTKELIEDLDLFIYRKVGDEWVIVEKDWEKVRDNIVASMTNFGYPYMTVDDGDFNHNSELLVRHHFEGQEMDLPYAEKTMEYLHLIWGRPVHLDTVFEGKRLRLTYTGDKHIRHVLDRGERPERGERG